MQLKVWLNEKAEHDLLDEWRQPHIFDEQVWNTKKGEYDLPFAISADSDAGKFQRFQIRNKNGDIINFDWPGLGKYG